MKALRLAVLLAAAAAALPGVAHAGDPAPAQTAALERLQAVSSTPVTADFIDGAPRFVSATVPVDGASATERALAYLDASATCTASPAPQAAAGRARDRRRR